MRRTFFDVTCVLSHKKKSWILPTTKLFCAFVERPHVVPRVGCAVPPTVVDSAQVAVLIATPRPNRVLRLGSCQSRNFHKGRVDSSFSVALSDGCCCTSISLLFLSPTQKKQQVSPDHNQTSPGMWTHQFWVTTTSPQIAWHTAILVQVAILFKPLLLTRRREVDTWSCPHWLHFCV